MGADPKKLSAARRLAGEIRQGLATFNMPPAIKDPNYCRNRDSWGFGTYGMIFPVRRNELTEQSKGLVHTALKASEAHLSKLLFAKWSNRMCCVRTSVFSDYKNQHGSQKKQQ